MMADEGQPNLRVLLACDWFVAYTAGLASGLVDIGCEVVLLTRDHDLEFGGKPGAMRSVVEETLNGKARHLELGGRVRDPWHWRDVTRLHSDLRRFNPDVTHFQDSVNNDMRLAFAGGFPRHKYAITVHDPLPHPGEPQLGAWTKFVRLRLLRGADLVFTHAAVLAEELKETGQVRAPVTVVPHGTGEIAVAPLPERPSLLFFGRIRPYKGLDTLLDAMPLVWQRIPETSLTIAGSSEVVLRHETIDDRRVTLRAEHVPQPAVPELFSKATCVVLPYRGATQSGVGAEATRHGRPIIATTVGGLPELVTPSSGRLVPPNDPKALADAIVEVIGTPGLAAEMGRNAAATAKEAGWRSVAVRTVEAYRRHLLEA